jgi:hypothetical protein
VLAAEHAALLVCGVWGVMMELAVTGIVSVS